MIDQIIAILGISHNYEFVGTFIAAAVVLLFLFEFLFLVSSLLKKIGGFK